MIRDLYAATIAAPVLAVLRAVFPVEFAEVRP